MSALAGLRGMETDLIMTHNHLVRKLYDLQRQFLERRNMIRQTFCNQPINGPSADDNVQNEGIQSLARLKSEHDSPSDNAQNEDIELLPPLETQHDSKQT